VGVRSGAVRMVMIGSLGRMVCRVELCDAASGLMSWQAAWATSPACGGADHIGEVGLAD
jgi:hypothetical protein